MISTRREFDTMTQDLVLIAMVKYSYIPGSVFSYRVSRYRRSLTIESSRNKEGWEFDDRVLKEQGRIFTSQVLDSK